MKKKRLTQFLTMLLCVAVLCGVPAYAAQPRASERIDRGMITLSKKSDGDLSISVSVRATESMKVIGATSVKVQRHTVSGWVTEHTFTPNDTPELQVENKARYDAMLTYSPLFTGKDYRVVAMIYAEDATGSSSKQLTSRTVAT